MIGLAALGGYGTAGLLVAACVVATLPYRRIATWAVTAVLGIVSGLFGGVVGALVLDVRPTGFFCAHAWAPAIAAAAILLAFWRAVAPRRL